jgi:hypothetical protein
MALVPTPARVKLFHACDQRYSSRVPATSYRYHRKIRPNTEGSFRSRPSNSFHVVGTGTHPTSAAAVSPGGANTGNERNEVRFLAFADQDWDTGTVLVIGHDSVLEDVTQLPHLKSSLSTSTSNWMLP